MSNITKLLSLLLLFSITACGADSSEIEPRADGKNTAYPMTNSDKREVERGKLSGDEGIALVGGQANLGRNGLRGESIARGVNAYLWQASLDTISFMPIATVDATGGVIITDWYQDPKGNGEKIKANIVISSDELRASGVKVSLFRQVGGNSAPASSDLARKLEDKILARARELRIEDDRF